MDIPTFSRDSVHLSETETENKTKNLKKKTSWKKKLEQREQEIQELCFKRLPLTSTETTTANSAKTKKKHRKR